MTQDERKLIEMALEALLHAYHEDEAHPKTLETITAIKEALAQPETPYKIGQRIAKTGGGISHLWSAVSQDDEIAEAERGFKEALAQPDQDEVDIRSRLYQRIHELETQLAREEQEPVALQYPQKDIDWQREQQIKAQASIPPQRKPLTRERLVEMAYAQCGLERTFEDWVELFAREIETAHGIKE